LIERLRAMAAQIADETNDARTRAREEGLDHAIVERLATRLIERAKECQRLLAVTPAQSPAARSRADY
jgi:serine/threonine-protein kinase HipA